MLTDGLTTHHASHFSSVTAPYEQQRCAGSYNSYCRGEADHASGQVSNWIACTGSTT